MFRWISNIRDAIKVCEFFGFTTCMALIRRVLPYLLASAPFLVIGWLWLRDTAWPWLRDDVLSPVRESWPTWLQVGLVALIPAGVVISISAVAYRGWRVDRGELRRITKCASSAPPLHDCRNEILRISHHGLDRSGRATMTRKAFFEARALGFEYFETDVVLSADGELFAWHTTSGLTSDTSDRLRERGAARLVDLLFHADFEYAKWNLEVKALDAVGPLLEFLQRNEVVLRGRVWLSVGWNPFVGQRARNYWVSADLTARSAMRTRPGDGGGRFPISAHQINGLFVVLFGTGRGRTFPCIQLPVPVLLRWPAKLVVKRAHKRGVQVHVWTASRESTMRWCYRNGVDGVLTDEPALLMVVLDDEHRRAAGETTTGNRLVTAA
ncbi:MAG: glycerophosphodiester phosphodiesterase family protein [Actinomycetota bacterium]